MKNLRCPVFGWRAQVSQAASSCYLVLLYPFSPLPSSPHPRLTPPSADTRNRVKRASIEALPTDTSLVSASDYILSIVPPRDALATAKRISIAISALPAAKTTPLYYLDLNAISPRSAREIATLFSTSTGVKLIDGGIIGGPPSLKYDAEKERVTNDTGTVEDGHTWNRPSIPLSGPDKLSDAPVSGEHLAETLNTKHINGAIGSASGLKCCFASTTKGATALCIQAFTTASRMGVLEELKEEMRYVNSVFLQPRLRDFLYCASLEI